MHAPSIAARPPRRTTLASTVVGEGAVSTINISGSAFSPVSITVASGDPVNFKNNDNVNHQIVVGENGIEAAGPAFEAISLGGSDQTHDIRFSPGTYKVTCTIHPSMNMTITVAE